MVRMVNNRPYFFCNKKLQGYKISLIMKIAQEYSHLDGKEHLIVHRPEIIKEIEKAIQSIDASLYVKVSNDKTKKGLKVYDQKAINKAFANFLLNLKWVDQKVSYYVTEDQVLERQICLMKDPEEQKRLILEAGKTPLPTYNQTDFVKDRVAIEVQFGKYFSIAYDLHVKHTFFFSMDQIDVGVEIIPTKNMMMRMDTGVGWFENEIANVIREGRSNPPVPIWIIGIEPDNLILTPSEQKKLRVSKGLSPIDN